MTEIKNILTGNTVYSKTLIFSLDKSGFCPCTTICHAEPTIGSKVVNTKQNESLPRMEQIN